MKNSINTPQKLYQQWVRFSNKSVKKISHHNFPISGSLKEILQNIHQHDMEEISNRLKTLDETIKGLSSHSNDDNERQVPRGGQNSNQLITIPENQIANLLSNLLTLQTTIQHSQTIPSEDIQPYLKRIEQSPLVRTDPDLQKVFFIKISPRNCFRFS